MGAYQHWLDEIVAGINRGHKANPSTKLRASLDSERPYLQTLPKTKAVDYNEVMVRVTSACAELVEVKAPSTSR